MAVILLFFVNFASHLDQVNLPKFLKTNNLNNEKNLFNHACYSPLYFM